ncbi:hypothetical protein Psta_1662 [Pirellula staleyi DSM 6068]|uniref:Uncharacterized protein n=1 Tax=Pirellula staleyi (strain ATCC 27377 / DSM 6068 / ICPB 4128) TaxID=530564 RepID=D2QYC3_PIRSD|nr:hypothetical protein [Pirellula staleyi]ADB16337.1 hypothetical protein Psta_1662 [Pirellula staleyi DSM 6068]
MPFLFALLPLLPLGIYILVTWIAAQLMIGPINKLSGSLKAPLRFQMSDFLWLMILLQVSMAVSVNYVGAQQRNYFSIVLTFLIGATILLWLFGVGIISRASITDPKRRALFLLGILPVSLIVLIGWPAPLLLLGAPELLPPRYAFSAPMIFAVTIVAVVVVGLVVRYASHWVVQGAVVATPPSAATTAAITPAAQQPPPPETVSPPQS